MGKPISARSLKPLTEPKDVVFHTAKRQRMQAGAQGEQVPASCCTQQLIHTCSHPCYHACCDYTCHRLLQPSQSRVPNLVLSHMSCHDCTRHISITCLEYSQSTPHLMQGSQPGIEWKSMAQQVAGFPLRSEGKPAEGKLAQHLPVKASSPKVREPSAQLHGLAILCLQT